MVTVSHSKCTVVCFLDEKTRVAQGKPESPVSKHNSVESSSLSALWREHICSNMVRVLGWVVRVLRVLPTSDNENVRENDNVRERKGLRYMATSARMAR